MIDSRSLIKSARIFLGQHAERLGVSLVQLREQLREAIAQRVATAVAEAVQSVTKRVLGEAAGDPLPRQPNATSNRSRQLWQDPMEPRARNGLQAEPALRDAFDEDDWFEEPASSGSGSHSPPSHRVPRTLLATLAVAAFCSLLSWLGLDVLAKSVKELSALTNILGSGANFLAA